MRLTNWLDETSKDLRIDWYIEPELAWEERTTQPDGSRLWIRRKIAAAREQHLQVALRDLFAGSTMTHLLLVDDAGSGKTVTSLRIEYLLNESSKRTGIFGDSLPRLVIHWSGRLPAGKDSSFESVLIETLTSQPSWRERVAALSSREQRRRARQLVDYALREQRLIVIVDAFDELTESQREKVADWFEDTSATVRWIITSRDDAVKDFVESERLFDPNYFRRLRLEPLNSDLQDQYIARALGKKPEEWRTWLQGSREEWDELLGLPNTLREIVRFVTSLGQQHPAWSSPSDMFCQFSGQMILRELKKRKHDRAWKQLRQDARDSELSRDEGVEFIEIVLGAVALEMATREKWTVVTSNQLSDEIKNIRDRVKERFTQACKDRRITKRKIVKLWEWAYNFASKFQLHKGSTQGILNARWISFRSKRIQEMWAARYITTYASELDLRDMANAKGCALGHNGDRVWTNLWECAIRMPIQSGDKPYGVDAQRYLRVMKLLFERPIQSDQRRPTELMWQAEQWLWNRPSLRGMVAELHRHLAAQFTSLKEGGEPSYRSGIKELLNPENYVLLCSPNLKLPDDRGSFTMGPDPDDRRKRTVRVEFTKPFAMARYTLTRGQVRCWDNGFEGDEARLAATELSWYDSYYFCRFLGGASVKLEDGKEYWFSLPTEAQWEYACRAGYEGDYGFDGGEEELPKYAWFRGNEGDPPREGVKPVGTREANRWGVHDMHGNVSEHVWDWYGAYPEEPQTDPVGPSKGSDRVLRGGSWYCGAADCRSASRRRYYPSYRFLNFGLRVALSSSGIPESPEAGNDRRA